jgi:hypothetical protein
MRSDGARTRVRAWGRAGRWVGGGGVEAHSARYVPSTLQHNHAADNIPELQVQMDGATAAMRRHAVSLSPHTQASLTKPNGFAFSAS